MTSSEDIKNQSQEGYKCNNMSKDNETPEFLSDALKFGINLGLNRMIRLDELLGNPEAQFRSIHLAGTNGKGSTTAFVSSILAASGLKVGVYTSPYLERFGERIRIIDGRDGLNRLAEDETYGEIDKNNLERLVDKVKAACDIMEQEGAEHPTEFELTTAVCYLWFAEQKIDVAVLETGLGGRLDSTNVISNPYCTLITAMGMDHADRLGSTISDICREKAGIFKKDCQALVYEPSEMILDEESQLSVRDTMMEVANEVGSPIRFVGTGAKEVNYREDGYMEFSCETLGDTKYITRLLGDHQINNCVLAISCVRAINGMDNITITDEDIYYGVANTYWKGRAELLSLDPVVLLDGGHNLQGATSLAQVISKALDGKLYRRPMRIVIGAMADKEVDKMIVALHEGGVEMADVYGVTVNNPRSMTATEICKRVKLVYNNGVNTVDSYNPCEAVEVALRKSIADGMPMLVTGSLYLIGQIRGTLKALVDNK